MTESNDLDFDRRLAELLADGPASAPERTIVLALDHAAAHPRRRDVLAAVRRDPMRSPAFAGSARVLPLVAALGLLVIVTLGAAFVGGVFNQNPVVLPVVSPSPTAVPTTEPTPGPSPITTPSGPPTQAVMHVVDLIEHVGADAMINVQDFTGELVRAESSDPGEGGSVEDGKIQITADAADPNTLILRWTGMPCDTLHDMDLHTVTEMTITRTACGGDTVPVDHVLRLTFKTPIDPATVKGTVVTNPRTSPAQSVMHIVDLIEHVGANASIDVNDFTGELVRADAGDPGEGGSVEDGKIEITADAADPATLILRWTGSPCDTTHYLELRSVTTMTITRAACSGDAIPVDHLLRLTFQTPIDPATVKGTVVTTS